MTARWRLDSGYNLQKTAEHTELAEGSSWISEGYLALWQEVKQSPLPSIIQSGGKLSCEVAAQCSTVYSTTVHSTLQFWQCSSVLTVQHTVQYSFVNTVHSAVKFYPYRMLQCRALLEVLCTVACSCVTRVGWLGTRHYLVSVIATGSAPTVTTAGVSLARGLNKSILRGSHIRRRQLQRCPQLAMRSPVRKTFPHQLTGFLLLLKYKWEWVGQAESVEKS